MRRSSVSWYDLTFQVEPDGKVWAGTIRGPVEVDKWSDWRKVRPQAERLRQARLAKGLTMGDVARHFGVKVTEVSSMERGRHVRIRPGHEPSYVLELDAAKRIHPETSSV